MTAPAKPSILFLGATGGCALTALIHALNDGFRCTALARTPSKLTDLLKNAGVAPSTLDALLTIQPGDATKVSDLKEALLTGSTDHHQDLPRIVVSGLGGTPQLQFGLPPFTIDQPTICQDSATALVTALSEIYASNHSLRSSKPLLSYVSTGGMYEGQDDIPWLLQMMYSYLLPIPWKDKKAMERIFESEDGRDVFSTVVGIKVTLLTDGPELGDGAIKVGTRTKPALGYSISRRDVGRWIYRNVVSTEGRDWEGGFVSITY